MYNEIEETAKHFNLPVEEMKMHLMEACSILYKARSTRPRPHLDDKIITAWNGTYEQYIYNIYLLLSIITYIIY